MSPPKTLTADQCEQLIEELLVNQGTPRQKVRGIRNASMAIVMLQTGIRVGELCKLRLDDLWYGGEPVASLIVRPEIAKNNKERQIPISQKAQETIIIMDATLWSPQAVSPCSYAFYTCVDSGPLTTRTVERIILDAGITAFNQEVTPHMLRHTFATRMLKKTNMRVVQVLLGHTSVQSTQIYTHPDADDLFEAINS